MNEKKLFVDVHAIQTLPPSCLNRDDTGSPKAASVGGVTRARVSSQAWKRAMRLEFRNLFEADTLGSRTKRITALVAAEIKKLKPETDDEKAEKLAMDALTNAGLKMKSAETGTDALFFLSTGQASALAALAVGGEKDKKAYAAALKSSPSIDMALFGRMVASDPSLNFDAAAQVAHSISTHEVHNEYDYFTAVDDCAPEDNAGAGHIGTAEFNAATLYRYATVSVTELEKSLGTQTGNTVRGFVDAFIRSMPTGKQNTFANRTFPDFVYVEIRRDQPMNLSGAFENPVVSRSGYTEESIQRLAARVKKLEEMYAAKPEKAFVIGEDAMGLGELVTLPELLEKLGAAVSEGL